MNSSRKVRYCASQCASCGYPIQPVSSRDKWCSVACRLKTILADQAVTMDDCWEWPLSRNSVSGYGQIAVRPGVIVGAHRAVYEAFVGPLEASQVVCHSCDNRGCVNPSHLFVGTQADNVADKTQKGRGGHDRRTLQSGDSHWARRMPERLHRSVGAELVAEIKDASGSFREIGRRFGVDRKAVASIKKGTYFGSSAGSAEKTALLAKK